MPYDEIEFKSADQEYEFEKWAEEVKILAKTEKEDGESCEEEILNNFEEDPHAWFSYQTDDKFTPAEAIKYFKNWYF